MSSLQQYQADFTAHIRNPKAVARPKGVTARRMKVYTEIVFNNMEATLSACFPVTRKVLGVRRWTHLVRTFFARHRCSTPWFRQIPEEFLRWLDTSQDAAAGLGSQEQVSEKDEVHGVRSEYRATQQLAFAATCSGLPLPPYLYSLAHYEWVELALALSDAPVPPHDPEGDLFEGFPLLAPALMLLRYDWPVNRISPRFKPQRPLAEPLHLLVFRDAGDEVRFIEINQLSARLLSLLQAGSMRGTAALQTVADELRHPEPAAILRHGATLLAEFRQQGAIIGVQRHEP